METLPKLSLDPDCASISRYKEFRKGIQKNCQACKNGLFGKNNVKLHDEFCWGRSAQVFECPACDIYLVNRNCVISHDTNCRSKDFLTKTNGKSISKHV